MVGNKLSGNKADSSPAPVGPKPRPSLKRNLNGYGSTEVDEPAEIVEMSGVLTISNDDVIREKTARLKVMLGRDGKIKYVKVLKSVCGRDTKNAVEAANRIHFRPARKDHRTVAQWLIIEYQCQ
jgi:hypothetical protein